MTSLIMAWLTGEAIVSYKAVHNEHHAPFPSELLATSGAFLLLAMLAEASPQIAGLLGWGFDIAAIIKLLGTPNPKQVSPVTTQIYNAGVATDRRLA